MKQLLFTISFFMLIASGFGQGLYLSFDAFCVELEKESLSDFGKIVSIHDEGDRYEAVFSDSTSRMLMLKLGKGEVFEAFERSGERYFFDGFEAVYIENNIMSMLLIYLPELDATLGLSSNASKQKSLLEKMAVDSGIPALKPDSLDWPSMIPVSKRLDGRPLRIKTKASNTEGYRFEVVADFWCDEQLISSIEKLRTSFANRIDFIEMHDMLLISKGESIGKIINCSSTNSKLTFAYYIK
ncbi:MAG: hypothetical protein KG029_16410 [Bacteroidetes bacterium]|nr:hypothetical protein [Bacteroidota bacterium]